MSKLISAYKSGNSYRINGNRVSSGQYNVIYTPSTGIPTHVTITGTRQGERPIASKTLITEVQKEDGNTYDSFAEFDAALEDFSISTQGQSSGIPADYTARNRRVVGSITYIGYSKEGTPPESQDWVVKRIDDTDGVDEFIRKATGSWNDVLTLIYN